MGETGQYLYAVARGTHEAQLRGCPGLGDVPLHVVEHRGLSAVLSEVDLDEFGEEALRRNLEDLAWLEKVARGHDVVVKAVAETAPTAPMRLATIFRTEQAVRARLDELYDALQEALDRVEGRMEWSVKAYAPAQPASASRPVATGAESGAAYLQRKRAQTLHRQSAEENALRMAEEVHEALSRRSVASRMLRPQDPRLTGHEGTMTLNGAYLVEVAEAESFVQQAERLAAEHPDAHLEVHGPWPPYSFATLEKA